MKRKILTAVGFAYLIGLFVLASAVSGANLNILNLDVTTDEASYDYEDDITSTIQITNTSETNYTENIQVTATFDEEIDLVNADDLTVEDGSIVWHIDSIAEGEDIELSFQTKLSEPPVDEGEDEAKEEDKDVVTIVEETDQEAKDKDELVAPQTGDESSMYVYVLILIGSIAIAFFTFVAIRKKKVSNVGLLLLAAFIITPTIVSNAQSEHGPNYVQSVSEKYNVEIAGEDYEYEVTINAEVIDLVQAIEVDPNEVTMNPESSHSFTVTGTKASGDEVNLEDSDHLSFAVSHPDKVEVVIGEDGLELHSTDEAEEDDEIEVIVSYEVNGSTLTDTITISIEAYVGTLGGQVFDAFTEEPIEEATVDVSNEAGFSHTVTTNENGEYATELGTGTYDAIASADGYIAEAERVEVSPNHVGTDDVNFYLVPEEYAGEGDVSGQITDALTGEGVEDVLIEVVKGKNNPDGEVIDTTTTDENGNYLLEDLEAGNYTLLVSADGYISTTKNVISIGNTNTENQNATITPILSDDEYRIVLTWGENPRDLDSHFTGPKADDGRFHVYFANKDYVDEHSEVNLDLDDTWSYGPETITVIKSITDGTYTYDVFNYTGRNATDDNKLDLARSSAKVEVYQGSDLVKTYNVPTNQEGNTWRVFQIVDGEIVNINNVETFDRHPNASNLAP